MSYMLTGRMGHFTFAFTLFLGVFVLVDQGTADAQGPLRRLGERIRARVEPLVQPQPAPQTAPPRDSNGLRPVAPYSPSTARTPSTLPAVPGEGGNTRLQPTRPSIAPAREPMLASPSTREVANTSSTPSIGIEAEEFNNGFRGLEVLSFRSNSKADSAGLQIGDIIVGIDGRETTTIADVSRALESMELGDLAQLRVVRREDLDDTKANTGRRQIPTQFVSVPLVDREIPGNQIAQSNASNSNQQVTYNQLTSDASLGVELSNASGRQGAVVTSVAPQSPGEVARMQAGDRIVSINGRMVQNASSVSQMLDRAKPGDQLRVQWVRGNQLRESNVILAGKDGISPNALASDTPLKRNETEGSAKPASEALFNGIGSAVGNWFGGDNKSSAKPEALDPLTELSGPSILMKENEQSDTLKPQANEPRGGELPVATAGPNSEELPMPKAVRDPLEFGDEELLQPVDSGEINKSLKPTVTAGDETTDPPSLEGVLPPMKKSADQTSKDDQTISLLLSEIEQLRSRVQELEKSKAP